VSTTPATNPPAHPVVMSHREVLEAMSGLLLAMFVAMLSSTVVSNALPVIVGDLHGTESGYTWVMVATLLALTATTPIWGKLADLYNKKMLVQIALVVYVAGSVLAGFATSMEMLIGARVVQGLGVGGLTALVQIVIASIVSPRDRGRYSGYLGATFAVATVSGPLIGGFVVDTLGWRWCFGVSVPVAILAFVVLQRTLHLPTVRNEAKIDILGATLIAAGLSILLAWVSLAGSSFAWASGTTALMVGLGVAAIVALVVVESRVAEPMIPLHLFKNRTVTLSVIASLSVGVAMFGSTVFLSQYFQLSHGLTPTEAGLMSLPLVMGLLVAGIGSGRRISRTGLWKNVLIVGAIVLAIGVALLSTIDGSTPLWVVGTWMTITGLGLGAIQQNLVLAVQNSVPHSQVGAASSLVATFRTMGGAVGVALLGTAMSHRVTDHVAAGLAKLGMDLPHGGHQEIPDLATLPPAVREVITAAYGDATGHVFLLVVPAAVITALLVFLFREVPLRTTIHSDEELEALV
jgi:EmrB/QacA subfamily drug resistance transporter